MKTHSWTQAKRDLGAIGLDTVWTCPTCGAEAGPVYPDTPGVEEPPSQQPYAPMRGLPPVSHDCDEAQQQIQALTEAQEEEQAFRDSMPHYLDPDPLLGRFRGGFRPGVRGRGPGKGFAGGCETRVPGVR
jgi:hypothetical protein